jgi:two-component system CheB/CheR fusion protein
VREVIEDRVISAILFDKPKESMIRAWVPGCGTGEDAYALAMLLIEQAESAGMTGELRVFATETDRAALAIAREGLYPASIAADLPPERLRRSFIREARGFRVAAELRRAMFFSAHDLARDPPYPQLDLIDCAHLPAVAADGARESIVRNLRRGLRPDGLLVQGGSPLIEAPGDYFEFVSDDGAILRRTAWLHPIVSDVTQGALFINPQLEARWITPAMTRLFGVGPADLKRPIEDIASGLGDPDLPRDARAVLEGSETPSRQVQGPHGRWFIRRMRLAQRPGSHRMASSPSFST